MVSCSGMLQMVFQRIRQHCIIISWIILISLVFWSSYSRYMTDPRYFYLREIIGCGLLFSRAMASVVNLSCFMVIIPMSRSFTTYIRAMGSKISVRYVRQWIDASRTFHAICAFTILIAGCLHSVAHVINGLNFSTHYNTIYKEINIANFKGEDPLSSLIGTVPGITGVFMIVILFVLSAAAVQYVRNVNYDLFWFSHHLFLLFFILLLCHPMSGVLKEQVNVTAHPPGCHINVTESIETSLICTEIPQFVSQNSGTWKWVAAGLTVYMVDLAFRLFRRGNDVELLAFQVYKSHVLYLKLLKNDFVAKPGQYIYLQYPKISAIEWHPFSLSECPSPNSRSFTIHLRTNGDWSGSLKSYLMDETREILKPPNVSQSSYNNISSMPLNQRILIDGPYSSCFEDVLQYSVSICIAGGIGITPFASILNYLRIDIKSLNKIKRIHLFWICREVEIFTCFAKLLSDVFQIPCKASGGHVPACLPPSESANGNKGTRVYHVMSCLDDGLFMSIRVWRANYPDKFEFYLYLTKKQSWSIIEDVLKDSLPFLKPRILFGRPQWKNLFQHWANIYKKTKVGMFCCGPEALNCDIHKLSQKWNRLGCHFSYHHEAFS